MALFANQWGRPQWVDADEMVDGLEAIDLEDREVWDAAEDGDIPTGRDPLDILLAIEREHAADYL